MKAQVTISRRNNNKVYIGIEDSNSHIEFVEVELTLEDYAMIITGLSSVAGEVTYRGLDCVGKTRVTEPRRVKSGVSGCDKEEHKKWLEENCREEGWRLNSYLGSQRSLSYENGKTVLNYSVYKYV